MNLVFDSFWRAAAYCLHPRVVALSFVPLVIMVAATLGVGWLYWDAAIASVGAWLNSSSIVARIADWLQGFGLGNVRSVLAPFVVIVALVPLIVIGSLVIVAVLMTPALVSLVAERRFPHLQRKKGASIVASVFWSLGSTLVAAALLVVSIPFWLIPPLVLVLPPLIWGWLTYRVMSFDVLADHASREERKALIREHRPALLGIGILTGYLGAAPSIVWASGVFFAAAFVVLVPVAIWIYTLVFAFSSLWFAHYALAALDARRAREAALAREATAMPPPSAAASTAAAPGPTRDDRPVTPLIPLDERSRLP